MTLFRVHDLRTDLRNFILMKLQENSKPTHFEAINVWVTQKFGGFFTKDIIFRVIDQLFQMGQIVETDRLQYNVIDCY